MNRFLITLCLLFTVTPSLADVAIVIHGGAGTITREKLTPELENDYRSILASVTDYGYQRLKEGVPSEQVVVEVIKKMEDSPLFNAGHGAVLTHDETVELDASIMRGSDLNAGAIAGVTRVKNPIELALAVMEQSVHVMLVGIGAETFAEQIGTEFVDNSYFVTPRRLEQVQRAKQRTAQMAIPKPEKYGTVGAVALDLQGNLSAGTSTGGMTNKRFGRVGDAPIIGAGTYADNQSCGVSATGHGEYFIRAAVAHDICARALYQGLSLQEAADAVIQDKLVEMGGDGGIIALTPAGEVVYSFNTPGMYRAGIDANGVKTLGIYAID
jgi:L-asparaginase / beta-aspartyl-peptidase